MFSLFKFIYGNPSPTRLAASFALGAMLGVISTQSPVWLVLFILIIVFRTHIISVIIGYLSGKLFAVMLSGFYVPIGKSILISNKTFWQNLLIKPFICYLNLNKAEVMGNLIVAVIFSIILFILIFPTLFFLKNLVLQKYKQRQLL